MQSSTKQAEARRGPSPKTDRIRRAAKAKAALVPMAALPQNKLSDLDVKAEGGF